MTVPLITVLPDPPLKTSPSDFAAKADTFLDALPDFCTETNAAITEINSLGVEVDTSASAAETSATEAAASAVSALANANASLYSASTTYGPADSVIGSDGNLYRCVDAGTIGDDPVGSITGDWVQITYISGEISVEDSSFIASSNDIYEVDTTLNTVEVTLPASPSAGTRRTLKDYAGTFDLYAMTVDNNGNPLMGLLESMVVDIQNAIVDLIYVDATVGWRRF